MAQNFEKHSGKEKCKNPLILRIKSDDLRDVLGLNLKRGNVVIIDWLKYHFDWKNIFYIDKNAEKSAIKRWIKYNPFYDIRTFYKMKSTKYNEENEFVKVLEFIKNNRYLIHGFILNAFNSENKKSNPKIGSHYELSQEAKDFFNENFWEGNWIFNQHEGYWEFEIYDQKWEYLHGLHWDIPIIWYNNKLEDLKLEELSIIKWIMHFANKKALKTSSDWENYNIVLEFSKEQMNKLDSILWKQNWVVEPVKMLDFFDFQENSVTIHSKDWKIKISIPVFRNELPFNSLSEL